MPAKISSTERRAIAKAVRDNPELSSDEIIKGLGGAGVYAEQLVFIAEQEFADADEVGLPIQAFELAQMVMRNYLAHLKKDLTIKLRAAESEKDEVLADQLRVEFQKVLNRGE